MNIRNAGDTRDALHHFEETVDRYLRELKNISSEQLRYKSNEAEWSVGQMIQHLIQSAMNMHIRNVQICMTTEDGLQEAAAVKTEPGTAIFEQGSFPPIRIQVPPSPEYTPNQPDRREQLVEGLIQVMEQMRNIEPLLEGASKNYTVPHPRFGGLNAREWFLLVEMHYRHHLLQLERLKTAWEGRDI